MLFLLVCALTALVGASFDPSLLHVNLQIRPYADSKKYVGTRNGEVAVIRGKNLEMNCRIHEAGYGLENTYTIFVDGMKICHIEEVVRVCGSNSSEAQEWNIVPFPAEDGGMGYMIREREDGKVHCMTRRDGEKNSLVMEPCSPGNGFQRWEIGIDSRTGALSKALIGSLNRKGNAKDVEA